MNVIKQIVIDFIPHGDHRYDTAGDWLYDGETLRIRVSETTDPRHAQLVAVHELAECLICNVDGVTQEMVDAFDMAPDAPTEPGDDPSAPYHSQHNVATVIEKTLAEAMHVDWDVYDDALSKLGD